MAKKTQKSEVVEMVKKTQKPEVVETTQTQDVVSRPDPIALASRLGEAKLDDLKVFVGAPFMRSSGAAGYAVTLADAGDGTTRGWQAQFFVTVTRSGGYFTPGPSSVRITLPETWNRLIAQPCRDLYEQGMQEGFAQKQENGLLHTARRARSGKGVRVISRVLDPVSPFYLLSVSSFCGIGDRGQYVLPSPDYQTGVTVFELQRRNVQAATLVPQRDGNSIIRDDDGNVVLDYAEPRWITQVFSPVDALAYLREQQLCALISKRMGSYESGEAQTA